MLSREPEGCFVRNSSSTNCMYRVRYIQLGTDILFVQINYKDLWVYSMLQKIIASHKLPPKSLKRYINTYWASYNPTNEYIDVPIVPNGCIYIMWKNGDISISGLTTSAYVINIAP